MSPPGGSRRDSRTPTGTHRGARSGPPSCGCSSSPGPIPVPSSAWDRSPKTQILVASSMSGCGVQAATPKRRIRSRHATRTCHVQPIVAEDVAGYSVCSPVGAGPASSSAGASYDPLSICSRMRRACVSRLVGTKSSAGPTGYGPSCSPLRSTGIPSASSRPFTISPSSHEYVENTRVKSSPTRPACQGSYRSWAETNEPSRSTPGQGADRTRRYQTELLRQREYGLSCEVAGQSLARAFLDTEEVGGSNPPAPTNHQIGPRGDR